MKHLMAVTDHPRPPSLSQRLLEFDLERRDLADEVSDGVGEGLLGTVVGRGLHPQDKLVLQGVGDLVPREEDLGVSEELAGRRRGAWMSEGDALSGFCELQRGYWEHNFC